MMVSPYLGDHAGQERVVRDSTNLLRGDGHEVYHLGDQHLGTIPPSDGHLILDGICRIGFATYGSRVNSLHARALQFIEACGPDVVHFTDTFDHRFVNRIVAKYPTVLSVHSVSATCPAGSRLIAGDRFCKKPSGWSCLWHNRSFHCLDNFKDPLRRANIVANSQARGRALRRVSKVIAISPYIKQRLIDDGWDESKIFLVPNPVTVPETESAISVPENLLVCAARLNPLKGISHLLRAVKIIEHLPWSLWICGEGEMRGELTQLVADLKLSSRVSFRGQTSYAETAAIVGRARALIQPNVAPEAFGLSVAEAMAMGTPVIATNVPALDDLVQDERNGLLVLPANPERLAGAIERILTDDILAQRLRSEATRAIAHRFSPERHLEKTLEVYQSLVGSASGAARVPGR